MIQLCVRQEKIRVNKVPLLEVLPKEGKVMVKGIAVVTRHVKARKQGEYCRYQKRRKFIDLSKVMPVCSSCKKPCRVNAKVMDNGNKSRVCQSM